MLWEGILSVLPVQAKPVNCNPRKDSPVTVWQQLQQATQHPRIAFLRYVVVSFFRHDCPKVASYLAFTSLFAVVPMMTVIYSILALIPELKGLEDTMQRFVFEHFVPSTGTQLEEHLRGFAQQASNLTSVGVMMLFVTAVMMLRKIETTFNTIWHVSVSRKGVNGFLLYWALLSLGPVLMGGTFAVSSYIVSQQILYDMVALPGFQKLMLGLLPILMSTVAFSLAYIAIPNTRVPIKHGIAGGLFAAILFDFARQCMTLFISLFPTYHLVYGAFAAVPIFLVWVLVSWYILLLGAEIVQALTNFQINKARSASSLGNLLSILQQVYRQQSSGQMLEATELLRKMPWLTAQEWEDYTDRLVQAKLLYKHAEGEISLTRDLHKYTLAQLFSDCFGDTLKLDLQDAGPWQRRVQKLHQQGIERCLGHWQINLAELFETGAEDDVTAGREPRTFPLAGSGE